MDDLECDICCNQYDEENCRPMVLKCGHTYCSICISKELTEGNTKCPTCRRPHKARSIQDLVLNITVERIIRNKVKSTVDPNTYVSEDEDEDDELSGGQCSMHKKSYLYFYCETHSMKICRECTVLDHQVGKCKVISFKLKVERQKEYGILQLHSNEMAINGTLVTLSEFANERDAIIKKNEIKIQQLKKDIDAATLVIAQQTLAKEKAYTEICWGNTKVEEIEAVKENIQNAMTKKNIIKCCKTIDSESLNITKWIEHVGKDLDLLQKDDEDDNERASNRSDGKTTISFDIPNISKLTNSVYSEPCNIGNTKWQISVQPTYDEENDKQFGFFLECCEDDKSSNWYFDTKAELRLLSQPFIRKIQHKFCKNENDWGYRSYLNWSDVINPDENYVKDDCITVEVQFETQPKKMKTK